MPENLPPDTSPFNHANLHPIGTHSEPGKQFGLLYPDGKILVNFDSTTSHRLLRQMARITGGELIIVHGTWTFEPDRRPESGE